MIASLRDAEIYINQLVTRVNALEAQLNVPVNPTTTNTVAAPKPITQNILPNETGNNPTFNSVNVVGPLTVADTGNQGSLFSGNVEFDNTAQFGKQDTYTGLGTGHSSAITTEQVTFYGPVNFGALGFTDGFGNVIPADVSNTLKFLQTIILGDPTLTTLLTTIYGPLTLGSNSDQTGPFICWFPIQLKNSGLTVSEPLALDGSNNVVTRKLTSGDMPNTYNSGTFYVATSSGGAVTHAITITNGVVTA